MSRIIKIADISEDTCNYIQMLHYELSGYRNLMASICKDTGYKKDKEIYDNLRREYTEANIAFELAMNELVATHCSDICDGKNIQPYVDFINSKVTFIENTLDVRCDDDNKNV